MKMAKAPPVIGSVYFFGTIDGPFVKIGWTKRNWVSQRLREVQTTCPYELRILHVIEGTEALETSLHVRFAKWKSYGEWFFCCLEIMEFVTNG